jgi:hypothetical protein
MATRPMNASLVAAVSVTSRLVLVAASLNNRESDERIDTNEHHAQDSLRFRMPLASSDRY